jgi:hypothetical protein
MAYYGHDENKIKQGEIQVRREILFDLLDIVTFTLACVINGSDTNYLQAKMVMEEMAKIRETLRMKPEREKKK